MNQVTFVDDVNQILKLDPDKKYIIRYASLKELHAERYAQVAQTLRDRLKELGLTNFIIVPHRR